MTASVFTLSIETTIHPAFQAPYHVGTDERIARQCAEETFQNRKWFADYGRVTIRTVALMRDGRVFDVFDGDWMSDLYEADMIAMQIEADEAEAAALDAAADEAAYYDGFNGYRGFNWDGSDEAYEEYRDAKAERDADARQDR
jgi:hypothetical protein